jgi:MYXO-CTERM domain-containing protein
MLSRWCLTSVVALAALVVPVDDASACSPNPCVGTRLWYSLQPVNAARVPTDGVLVLQAGNFGDAPLSDIALAVTRDGIAVDGALEATDIVGVLVWRPAAPLQAGVHVVTGTIDNPEGSTHCQGDLALDFEFTAEVVPPISLTPLTVTPIETVEVTPIDELASLACCGEVVPETIEDSCGGTLPGYKAGECAPTRGTGWLEVELTTASTLPDATAVQVAYVLKVDGAAVASATDPKFSWRASAPFCTVVEATQLATGEKSTTGEQCHGEAVADQLGDQPIDPTLATMCIEALQVCEVDPMTQAWDASACSPWADEQAGCGCVGGDAPDPWGALAVLGLAALRRRRRARA